LKHEKRGKRSVGEKEKTELNKKTNTEMTESVIKKKKKDEPLRRENKKQSLWEGKRKSLGKTR